MDTYLIRLIFAFGVLVSSTLCQSCEPVHYQRCVDQLVSFAGKEDLIFAFTEEEMRQQCIQAQSAMGCITRFIKKCLKGPEEKDKYSESIEGVQKLTSGLCNEDSDLRSRYLQSLPCFQNISDGVQFCQEKFERNQKDIVDVPYQNKVPLFCCSFDGYRRCLKMLLQLHDECREGPTEVMEEIVGLLAGSLGDGLCGEYFEKCTGGFTSRLAAASSLILASIGVIFLAKYL